MSLTIVAIIVGVCSAVVVRLLLTRFQPSREALAVWFPIAIAVALVLLLVLLLLPG